MKIAALGLIPLVNPVADVKVLEPLQKVPFIVYYHKARYQTNSIKVTFNKLFLNQVAWCLGLPKSLRFTNK